MNNQNSQSIPMLTEKFNKYHYRRQHNTNQTKQEIYNQKLSYYAKQLFNANMMQRGGGGEVGRQLVEELKLEIASINNAKNNVNVLTADKFKQLTQKKQEFNTLLGKYSAAQEKIRQLEQHVASITADKNALDKENFPQQLQELADARAQEVDALNDQLADLLKQVKLIQIPQDGPTSDELDELLNGFISNLPPVEQNP